MLIMHRCYRRVLYGLLRSGDQAAQPPLPVESFRVMPPPYDPGGDLDGYWILDQIKDILTEGRHKLVNLSLGPTLAVEDDNEPNRWTAELDQLAWERDIVFVVAAGNDGNQDRDTGLHRVQVPADMANAISVGACDVPAPDRPWTRAPYSSMGPGRPPGNRTQPLGVQFGGVDDRMFDVLCADGTFLEATGTSFAAPVVTHALADLTTRLPRVNSSVLRAFPVHFAERIAPSRSGRTSSALGGCLCRSPTRWNAPPRTKCTCCSSMRSRVETSWATNCRCPDTSLDRQRCRSPLPMPHPWSRPSPPSTPLPRSN